MPNNYNIHRDQNGNITHIETDLTGVELLDNPRLNKDNAFTEEERKLFELEGKLPFQVNNIEQQSARIYEQYKAKPTNIERNIHLNALHDSNETLFYHLVSQHLEEMLPIIYTPTIGEAVENFSLELRRRRGLYICYQDRDRMDEILANRANQDLDLMVVTDGEGVLGIGDQGIGGMDISIGKLMVYVLCGGINPLKKLPIVLDVGTNNQQLLNNPMYMGWRHARITGQEYDDFIGTFVESVQKHLPGTFLHWEDFGRDNARKNLLRYRDEMLSFNDDMQGTGAITLSVIMTALHAAGRDLKDERIVFMGAGTAGTGIADQIRDAIVRSGLSTEEANKHFWLIDRPGLLIDSMEGLTSSQEPYARPSDEIKNWKYEGKLPMLEEVVENVKPTILIGCSTASNAFNENVVKTMAAHTKHPIIMPLSNPTSKSEGHPANILNWSEGRALVATGSPYADVEYNGKKIRIGQCNNAFIFPGIGLAVIACKATRLSDDMLWAASLALSSMCPAYNDPTAPLLPDLSNIRGISRAVAIAVINQARKEGLSGISDDITADQAIDHVSWDPTYYPYKKMKQQTAEKE
jgi:malate dehydrogenase (oxaloacetate-decarboxylating)